MKTTVRTFSFVKALKNFVRKPAPTLLTVAALAAGGCFLDAATSQTNAGKSTGTSSGTSASTDTVTPPVPREPAEAAKALGNTPPLDPAKLGDPLPRNIWVELSKLLNPTVVSITTTQAVRQVPNARYRDPLQDFLEEFWGGRGGPNFGPAPRSRQPATALGTGFIFREDGLIITNNHVVEQADTIKVSLGTNNKDEKLYEAEVIGRDSRTDIALIKIKTKEKLPVARLGDSKAVEVGEYVAAFGNPYGHAHTMTTGIVSAIGREIAEINRFPFIQTDASINPGNSGGPLVNSLGYVIGVNTAIDARAQGIGFAIPIDNVKQIVAQLEKDGRVRRGFIGVAIRGVDEEIAMALGMTTPRGVIISQILQGGPADKAGIRPNDVVVEFGGKRTDSAADLQNAVGDTAIGTEVKTKVWRFDDEGRRKEMAFNVKVLENPEEGPKKAARKPRQLSGQKAPHDLGFKVADFSPQLAQEFGLPPETHQGPIITEVDKNSPASAAGLEPGDIILNVRGSPVAKTADVIKLLRKGRNLIHIERGGVAMPVPLGR